MLLPPRLCLSRKLKSGRSWGWGQTPALCQAMQASQPLGHTPVTASKHTHTYASVLQAEVMMDRRLLSQGRVSIDSLAYRLLNFFSDLQ